MKFNKLILTDFGKFKDKDIQFLDNLNIVYGKNEAGKSTVHSFIEGMLYGFLRPYATRALYKEEHEKYMPWNSNQYKGSMIIEKEGTKYRIDRNFLKGQEETKVYVESTGEDVTDSLDIASGSRILQPGIYFFGFNDTVYNNTISIGQLQSLVDDNLSKEVKDKITNMSTALDEDISVKNALLEIDKKINEIGTEKAKKTPYGSIIYQVEKLKEEKCLIDKNIKDLENSREIRNETINKLKVSKEELANLKEQLRFEKYLESVEDINHLKKIKEEIKDIENRLKDLEQYRDISFHEYSELTNLLKEIEYLLEKINLTEKSINEIEDEIKSINISNTEVDLDIIKDFSRYEELDMERTHLHNVKESSRVEFLNRDYLENKEKENAYKILLGGSLLLSAISIFALFFIKNLYPLIINIITVPMVIAMIVKIRRVRGLILRIESYGEEIKKKEQERITRVISVEKEKNEILQKYNLKNKLELKRLYDLNSLNKLRNEDTIKSLEVLKNKKIALNREVNTYKTDLRYKKNHYKNRLDKVKVDDIDEYKISIDKNREYEELQSVLQGKLEIVNSLENHIDIKNLENYEQMYNKNKFDFDSYEKIGSEKLEKLIEYKSDEVLYIEKENIKLEEKVKQIDNLIKTKLEIEESINRKEFKIKEYSNKLRSLNLARDTIEKLSKNIHREFAPVINQKVEEIVAKITNNKYTEVRIDENLDIKIVNPNTEEIVGIEGLSGGTIDQIYFGLRLGIIQISSEEKVPLILDDCFIQYDDHRIENILKFLVDESKDRQIILFTCQKREVEVLDKLEIDYNLIEL